MTSTDSKTAVAREYLRVSLDKTGEKHSTDEQHDQNRHAAESHGWQLGEPYTDTGSASRYSTKARGEFDRLMADLRNDAFGADVLILWESSRGSRREGEWVTLVDLLEERGVLVHVTTHGRTYDASNPRDRRSLLEDAIDSAYESSKMSGRLKRTIAARAAAGAPHGREPYGYRRRYEIVGARKVFVAQEPHPTEAPVVRELFDRITKGHSLKGIAKDFAARGITKHSGGPFSAPHLRDIALRPLYIGKRAHRPGTSGGRTSEPGVFGTLYAGSWEPLVSEAKFYAVQRILAAPERKTSRPGRGTHLLSMIARCGVCSGPLTARNRRDRSREYQCPSKGCVRVDYVQLTELAEEQILDYLGDPDLVGQLTANDGRDDAELRRIEDDLAKHRARLDELEREVERGETTARMASAEERGLNVKIADAEVRKAELSTPSALRDMISPGADVARRWKGAPMSTKRAVARLLLAPDVLGELRVVRKPHPGPTSCPVQDRIVLRVEDA